MTTSTDFYIKRTYGDFFGKVSHVDFIGPYGEDMEFAVDMQRGHDQRRAKPAQIQIIKWEWVQGKDA